MTRWARPARSIAVIAVALGLIVLTVTNGTAHVAWSRAPDTAVAVFPPHARAQAAIAARKVTPGATAAELADADRRARSALERDPTVVAAVRTLGFLAVLNGQSDLAERYFKYSAGLSSRDFATRLWLVERAVAAEDLEAALRHYDIALRTSATAERVLLPTLVKATADARIIAPLADVLSARPTWRAYFIGQAVGEAPDPRTIAQLVTALDRRRSPVELDARQLLVQRLVRESHFASAGALAGPAPPTGLRGGAFEASGNLPPFDWELSNSPGVIADIGLPEDRASPALLYDIRAGASGYVARQLLLLAPGVYALDYRSGTESDDLSAEGPRWDVACAERPDDPFAEARLANSTATGKSGLAFRVPAGCRAQWLTLKLPPTGAAAQARGWVDDIGLSRRGP